MLCVPSFSSLSIEECHNILPCKRTLRPSQNRTWRFPSSGSSAKLTHRTTVCKHTIHATRSVPAKNIVTFLSSPLRYEDNIASVMLSISEYGIRYSSLYALLLTPSSEPTLAPGTTPFTPLIWNDLRQVIIFSYLCFFLHFLNDTLRCRLLRRWISLIFAD